MAIPVEELLDIKIDSAVFASLEGVIPELVRRDPYSFFEHERERSGDIIVVSDGAIADVEFPVFRSSVGNKVYVACGFDTVRQIVSDQSSFYQDYGAHMDILMGENQLAGMNPPLHAKYRALVMSAFDTQSIRNITAELIEPIVDGLISRIRQSEKTELVQDLACRLPVLLIGQIFNLPIEKYNDFATNAGALMMNAYDWPGAVAASKALGETFEEIIEERRRTPGSDLISDLIHAEIDGEKLPDSDIVSTCRAVVPAGIETTVKALSTLMALILDQPEKAQIVRQNLSLIPAATDELLRWNGPAQLLPKRTVKDVEIDGTSIPAGSHIYCYIGHANRDPRHWEHSESFDPERKRSQHLAFSFGPHFCVGNQLARAEIEVVFRKTLEKLPNLRRDPEAPEHSVQGVVFRSADFVHGLV